MRVRPVAEGEDAARWDAYVGPRTSTVSDLAAWRRVVRDAYGLRDHFLIAMEGERIVGALGLYEIEHPIFGHYLTTAIFATEGGFHYDDDSARDALLAEARALASIAAASPTCRSAPATWRSMDSRSMSTIAPRSSTSRAALKQVWKRLPSKTRNQVRRGEHEGFSLATGHDQLGAFFDVFQRHMRDLGSPAHGARFYESIVEHLGEHADFLVVREGNALVGGALLFQLNGTAMNLQTVALRAWNRRCPNYLLYWKIIESSCAAGSRWLDMGRSEAGSSQPRLQGQLGIARAHAALQLPPARGEGRSLPRPAQSQIPHGDPRLAEAPGADHQAHRPPTDLWAGLMSFLVVNADDLGVSRGANLGTVRAHREGIVTSASLAVTTPFYEHAVETCVRACPDLGIGLHFTLTSGRPVSPPERVPLLIDRAGFFCWRFLPLLARLGPGSPRDAPGPDRARARGAAPQDARGRHRARSHRRRAPRPPPARRIRARGGGGAAPPGAVRPRRA